jgi:hypothetical protein
MEADASLFFLFVFKTRNRLKHLLQIYGNTWKIRTSQGGQVVVGCMQSKLPVIQNKLVHSGINGVDDPIFLYTELFVRMEA